MLIQCTSAYDCRHTVPGPPSDLHDRPHQSCKAALFKSTLAPHGILNIHRSSSQDQGPASTHNRESAPSHTSLLDPQLTILTQRLEGICNRRSSLSLTPYSHHAQVGPLLFFGWHHLFHSLTRAISKEPSRTCLRLRVPVLASASSHGVPLDCTSRQQLRRRWAFRQPKRTRRRWRSTDLELLLSRRQISRITWAFLISLPCRKLALQHFHISCTAPANGRAAQT